MVLILLDSTGKFETIGDVKTYVAAPKMVLRPRLLFSLLTVTSSPFTSFKLPSHPRSSLWLGVQEHSSAGG
jgi:hypothetical protein